MWKKIKSLFKKKTNSKTFNIYHEDFADKVEPALDNQGKQFEVNGVKYYRFKSDTHMPYGRYKFVEMFIKQVELNMTKKILIGFIDKIEKNISGEMGAINLTKAYEAIQSMRARVLLTFDIETVYSYASVIYFDDTENLYDYEKKINDAKISSWREANSLDFFYMRPISELFGLRDISKQDLAAYINIIREVTGQTSEITEP